MIKWIRCVFNLHNITINSAREFLIVSKSITQLQNKCDNLVDRISQLEQTVQSLSDENQLLIQTVYQKGKQNG